MEIINDGKTFRFTPDEIIAFGKSSVDRVRDELLTMTDNKRLEVFSKITYGYCTHCGTNDPKCQCWNDE